MFSSRWFLGFFGLALVGIGGWKIWERRQETAGVQMAGGVRLAVLPCENQTSRDDLSALAASTPRILQMQLESEPALRVLVAPTPSDAMAAGATHLLHLQLTDVGGASMEARVENAAARTVVASAVIRILPDQWSKVFSDLPGVVLGSLKAKTARLIAPPAEPALRALMAGYAAASPEESARQYESAVAADARCGWCWVALAETAQRQGGAAKATEIIARYRSARPAVDPGSAARLDLLEATVAGDPARQVQALWKLAELRPNDTAALVSLAQLAQRMQQNEQAEKALLRVVQLEPALPDHWNTLAYVQAYQSKWDAALKSVGEYERLAPGSPNPLDSKGEILFMSGRFAEAESAFLASAKKEADFNAGVALEKAALSRLLNGDAGGAAAIAERYVQQRSEKQDALAPFHRARWDWLLGHRAVALGRMQTVAQSDSPAASLAAAKLSLWGMESGDERAAQEWAKLAARKARLPVDQTAAITAVTVAGLGEAVRGLAPQTRGELLALRQILRGEFAGAADSLQKLAAAGQESVLARSLRATAEARAGKPQSAAKGPDRGWPILSAEQFLLLDSTVFQGEAFTRAEAALAAKNAAEARKLFDVYLRSMGDARDRFGTMAKARGEARL